MLVEKIKHFLLLINRVVILLVIVAMGGGLCATPLGSLKGNLMSRKKKKKSKKKYDWFDISNQDKKVWEQLCPVNEYRIIKPLDFPNVLPKTLVDKYDSIFVMASGSNNGVAYYMANGNRVDFRASLKTQIKAKQNMIKPKRKSKVVFLQ